MKMAIGLVFIYSIPSLMVCTKQANQCGVDLTKPPITSSECILSKVPKGRCCYGTFYDNTRDVVSTTCITIQSKDTNFKHTAQLLKHTLDMNITIECLSKHIYLIHFFLAFLLI